MDVLLVLVMSLPVLPLVINALQESNVPQDPQPCNPKRRPSLGPNVH